LLKKNKIKKVWKKVSCPLRDTRVGSTPGAADADTRTVFSGPQRECRLGGERKKVWRCCSARAPAREGKETETKRELPKACEESKGVIAMDGKKDELDAKG
jgi:hypothetical protein